MKIEHIIGFKPKLIPTMFTIPALIVLFSLSIWQFQRLTWKEATIQKIRIQIEHPIAQLPQKIDLATWLYRPIEVEGSFLYDQELYLYGGSRQFKGENGYYILTPLRLDDERIIIINRGWVPEKLKDQNKRPETVLHKRTKLIGYIMKSEERPLYVHDNDLKRNLWFYINLNEIQQALNEKIEDFYILAKEIPNQLPRGRNLEPNIRNNHLSYALTWLFSAITLLVIYIMYHRREERG